MTEVIRTEGLTKYYREVHAAESVNLEVKQGEIYGFLGLNGAGKTTTIRMLLGMIRPTRGTAWLFGEKVDSGNRELWNRVGHLVEIPYAYPELTVAENLEIFRRLRFLKDPGIINKLMDKLYLSPYRNTKARNLSLGNAQRLGIARAMIHNPGLLILDEPANGLDPSGIVQIRELLMDLAENQGVTIFLSSHILGEISKIASRIGIIHEGVMIREASTDHIHDDRSRILHVNTLNNTQAQELFKKKKIPTEIQPDGSVIISDDEAILHPENISSMLVSEGLPLTRISVEEEDLEHYFFRIIQSYRKAS